MKRLNVVQSRSDQLNIILYKSDHDIASGTENMPYLPCGMVMVYGCPWATEQEDIGSTDGTAISLEFEHSVNHFKRRIVGRTYRATLANDLSLRGMSGPADAAGNEFFKQDSRFPSFPAWCSYPRLRDAQRTRRLFCETAHGKDGSAVSLCEQLTTSFSGTKHFVHGAPHWSAFGPSFRRASFLAGMFACATKTSSLFT